MIIDEFKKILAKNKLRYVAEEDVTPSPDRAYRVLPADRWASLLGVSAYDMRGERDSRVISPESVTIYLSQHIGAPSLPLVKEGDAVTKGQPVAAAAEGLSVPQHASIDGQVTLVDHEKIIIERV